MSHRLVFAGDSITDAGRDREDDASYGDGWVARVAAELADTGHDAVVVNRGISGDRAVDLERRWDRDVLAEDPDVLTVYVGVNDMWRRFDSGDPTTPADFETTYRGLLTAARDRAPLLRLLLVEPFFLPDSAGQEEWSADLDEKRAAVARVAHDNGAELVRLQDRMTRAAAEAGVAAIAPDGVHPTPQGSRIIADAWLAAFASLTATTGRQ